MRSKSKREQIQRRRTGNSRRVTRTQKETLDDAELRVSLLTKCGKNGAN
jgi:hypothetical protein